MGRLINELRQTRSLVSLRNTKYIVEEEADENHRREESRCGVQSKVASLIRVALANSTLPTDDTGL